MDQYLKKYRYLIISSLLRIYLIYILADESIYLVSVYDIDSVFFHFVIGLGITLMDILYILQSCLYIYQVKNQIMIRLWKKEYYIYSIKNILICYFIITIMQGLLQMFFYHHLSYHFMLYSFILLVSNVIIFRFDNEQTHNYLILLSLIINSLFKLFWWKIYNNLKVYITIV